MGHTSIAADGFDQRALNGLPVDFKPTPLRLASAGEAVQAAWQRQLQAQLGSRLIFTDGQPARWSPAATALFLLSSCGAFWAILASTVLR